MDKVWLKQYPPGVPDTIDAAAYRSLVELLDEALARHARRVAYRFMGRAWTFADIDKASRHMAAYLQGLGLQPGERVAVMLPNVPQYPIAVAGVLRAGLVLVNINPDQTPTELAYQLRDSGCRAIVVLETAARKVLEVRASTALEHVVITGMGDMLGLLRRALVNRATRRVRKLVSHHALSGAVSFKKALRVGRGRLLLPVARRPDDLALLQYTGGTTGQSKAAMLLHRNLVASVLQAQAWNEGLFKHVSRQEPFTFVAAMPLHHMFGFAVNLMLGLRLGACNLLLPDAGDAARVLDELSLNRFHSLPGSDVFFASLARHPDVEMVDWSALRQSVSGGAAVHQATAKLWRDRTGQIICEAYGLSETAGGVCCNLPQQLSFSGGIGLPLPSTELAVLDEQGRPLPPGNPGELAVRGPQVMAGYWQRPQDTAEVMTSDGFLRTGDIGLMDERGYFRFIERKQDVIKVSGFKVYPNDVDDSLCLMPGVRECAAVGMADAQTGEAVKLFIVRDRPEVTEQAVREYCAQVLIGYKRPKVVVFVDSLPRDAVGKVLRRLLREWPQGLAPDGTLVSRETTEAPSA